MKRRPFILLMFLLLRFFQSAAGPVFSPAVFLPPHPTPRYPPPPSDSQAVRILAVPLVFYSYDTRWGFGGAGILTFPGKPLRSNITFSLAYTQRKQWLLYFPYQLFVGGGRWRVYGELGWYRYLYQFFGVGNNYPDDFIELYTAQFPRVRATAAKAWRPKQLLGLRYNLDAYRVVETEKGGVLENDGAIGAGGGLSSGLGPVWLYDSRDNQFFPRKGWLAELSLYGEDRLTGSDFKYLRFSAEAAHYRAVGRRKRSVFAAQITAQLSAGDAPFFLLPQLGGSKRLRGYLAGKYRDDHLLLLQTEYRFPLIWRFKGVAFASAGGVFGTPGETIRLRPDGGLGLRFEFDRVQHIHLRVDYGLGAQGNSGLYVTFGEAF
jgi:Omp85 superfamily domain